MFPGSIELEIEAGFLRSGGGLRLGKIRKMVGGRLTPSVFEESEYEVESQLDRGSCDKEEYYITISEGEEEFKESIETPRSR